MNERCLTNRQASFCMELDNFISQSVRPMKKIALTLASSVITVATFTQRFTQRGKIIKAVEDKRLWVFRESRKHHFEGIKEVDDAFDAKFKEIGFTTTWTDQLKVNRAGRLFAKIKGNNGKRLLLIGHLDTVFNKDSPFQKWVDQDTIELGPGSNDIKVER